MRAQSAFFPAEGGLLGTSSLRLAAAVRQDLPLCYAKGRGTAGQFREVRSMGSGESKTPDPVGAFGCGSNSGGDLHPDLSTAEGKRCESGIVDGVRAFERVSAHAAGHSRRTA